MSPILASNMLQPTHLILKISLFLFLQFKPVVKNQEEEGTSQNKGSKKKVDKKGANKLGAAQAAS
jgi:hypothetical protein